MEKRILVVGGTEYFILVLNNYLRELEIPAEVFAVASISEIDKCDWFDFALFPVLVGWDDTIELSRKLLEQRKPFAVLVHPISATFKSLYEGMSDYLFWEWDFVLIAQHINEVLGGYK